MDRLLLIDTAMRLMGVGQLVLMALVVGRSGAPARIRWTTILLLTSVAAYLSVVSPTLHLWRSAAWPAILILSLNAPLALWVFALLIFERPIDWRLFGLALGVTLIDWAFALHARYVTHEMPLVASGMQHAIAFLLAAHAIAIAIANRGDDLLEKRRAFRLGFVVVVGVETLGVVVAESAYGLMRSDIWLMLLQSSTSLLAILAFGAAMLSANAELLFDADARPPERAPLSPAEHVLKGKLDAAMARRVYRESGLTIGVLADRLGTPEHRLRALINQRLGYRNFSDFLNSHRIGDARAWLGDPGKVDLPVLTLAMDLGYDSLAPFNRAFREATGTNPSDYRRSAILEKS
ncbi:AraC family transcriptional regulator [Sphingomonas sp. R-74633]|uniref:AraC family transcriptional regulator n=1 Tax=Sphingomonas sp. R-74633 TaxID=2751188 RepID=UPI0015D34E79|nr:helix-turn-helix domain-containing protein [Sphingomonas sp. R-74633]NYT40489.1 AraC family transcriptional regulator [Sphingomonas sp. R-74633]